MSEFITCVIFTELGKNSVVFPFISLINSNLNIDGKRRRKNY